MKVQSRLVSPRTVVTADVSATGVDPSDHHAVELEQAERAVAGHR
jgi:hypothetical protein